MPFPNYSDSGGSFDRFRGPVESAIKNKAGTGAPLTSQTLQDIGRTIDDEIEKVAPPTPSSSNPIDTVEIKASGTGSWLTVGAGQLISNYKLQVVDYELVNAYKYGYDVDVPVLIAKSTDGTAEIIQISAVLTYARETGVDSNGWVGRPDSNNDEYMKWISGVQATQLYFKKAQFVGDGKTLVMTTYDTDTSSGSAFGNANGLYHIYYHGTLTGNPTYDASAKCWVGRVFTVSSALIVYSSPVTGKQYVTEIKK